MLVGGFVVGEFHVGAVPLEFPGRANGDVAQERGLGEQAAVGDEVRAGRLRRRDRRRPTPCTGPGERGSTFGGRPYSFISGFGHEPVAHKHAVGADVEDARGVSALLPVPLGRGASKPPSCQVNVTAG